MVVTVNCGYCDEELERYPYQLEGKSNVFCDKECHRQYQIDMPPEEHGNYQGGYISVDCSSCGEKDVKEVPPVRVEQQDNFFCDMNCLGRFNETRYAGEGNPNYKGGDWEHNYRGANWAPTRNEVRRLDDYTCQKCGSEMKELGQIPDCHHIIPESSFESREDAHYIENLVLLCRDCHDEFDAMEPAEQVDALGVERVQEVMQDV